MFSLNTQHIIYHLLTHINPRLLFFCLFLSLFAFPILSQEPVDTLVKSSGDTLISFRDSLVTDSLAVKSDSLKSEKSALEAEVKYSSDDSMSISITEERIYLYNNAVVDYQNIGLKANYIEFNLIDHTVSANGIPDSSGALAGKPVFTQGSEEFDSDTMRYNFDTHKGIIKYIITKQGDGYLHSERTKRLADGEIHVARGKYTTCDLPHPHFYIRLTRAIVIPEKRIVSGPAYMVVEDIPLPLALPFGFFPNTSKRSSGLIIPTYGEETSRGMFLRTGGWYFVLGEHFDATLLGTIYARGSWEVIGSSVYTKRYKFSGKFQVNYAKYRVRDDPNVPTRTDFRILWSHQQDPKANPNQTFRASVDLSTTQYEKRQSYDVSEVPINTKQSTISYSRKWGDRFNLTANLSESQNNKTHIIDLSLPTMAFNMNRLYPFRGKNSDGRKWLDKVQITYAAKLDNKISTPDSVLFKKQTFRNMRNGFYHSIPVSMQGIKLFKIINITPTLSYNGMFYSNYTVRGYPIDTLWNAPKKVLYEKVYKATYAQSLSTSIGISASPKIYGMYVMKNPDSKVIAIRHVMTPSVSFSYVPDLSGIMPDYYRKISTPHSITKPAQVTEYSIYEKNIYGTPTVNGRSGSVSLSLNNNLEMKVRERTDSSVQEKKISLLDNLNFSTSYNPFATRFNWSQVNMQAATSFFKKQLNLNFSSTFDPYAVDTTGIRIDKFLFSEKHKLFRMTRASLSMGFSLRSKAGEKEGEETAGEPPRDSYSDSDNPTVDMLNESTAYASGAYVNFDIPWSVNVDYSWGFTMAGLNRSYTNSIRVNGDLNLTPKWKIGVNTGYDIEAHEWTLTNISIHRDLHCWEMRFSVVPFGERRSYSFTINAKSSLLRDVKYNKNKSWYDNL